MPRNIGVLETLLPAPEPCQHAGSSSGNEGCGREQAQPADGAGSWAGSWLPASRSRTGCRTAGPGCEPSATHCGDGRLMHCAPPFPGGTATAEGVHVASRSSEAPTLSLEEVEEEETTQTRANTAQSEEESDFR